MTAISPIYFLLVDDREENLVSLEALLRRDGLRCLMARSGREALELLLQYDVALALLDVQMPDMDGFELAELMRGNQRTGAIPIIFLTAGAADSQRKFRGYQAGAVDFINKPIEADILRSKAEVFFQLSAQKNQLAAQRDELRITAEENARLLLESHQYADALKKADQHKDEFLATLAHELRNPLATISGALQIMGLPSTEDEAKEMRQMMDRQVAHLVRLIDDLLDVSRISRGRIELRMQRVQLQAVLNSAVELSRHLIDEGQHTLKLDIEAEDIWLQADATRLAQTVSNLLNNSAKYTPPGGIILLRAFRRDQQAVISVKDTGVGISKEMLAQVFGLFTQIHPSSSSSYGGLGIGLALAKNLVEKHQGSIEAESDGEGKGSVFTITLPISHTPAPPVAANEKKESPPPATRSLRILVVDDNVDAAKTLSRLLTLQGHHCAQAHSGAEALTTAREYKPEAILLDIGLPDTTGYEVCRQLRREADFQRILVIAQTGWGQTRDIERSREAGFDHHLIKPVELKALKALFAQERTR